MDIAAAAAVVVVVVVVVVTAAAVAVVVLVISSNNIRISGMNGELQKEMQYKFIQSNTSLFTV
jgi:hypothetical protein